MRGAKYAFLVAKLASADETSPARVHVPREKQIGSHDLFDDREHFLEMGLHRHWQFDDLRRAQWTTMMVLASLGGPPEGED